LSELELLKDFDSDLNGEMGCLPEKRVLASQSCSLRKMGALSSIIRSLSFTRLEIA
jgi:hypothetical protein